MPGVVLPALATCQETRGTAAIPPMGSSTQRSCVACFLFLSAFLKTSIACFFPLCCFQQRGKKQHVPNGLVLSRDYYSQGTTTLQHVPKGARNRWAHVLSVCLSSVRNSSTDISQWSRLFMLTKCVLASPAIGHRLRLREILQCVRSRLHRWSDGDLVALWSEALDDGQSLSRRSELSASASSHNIRRAKRAVQDGQYRKAIKALTSDGLANPSPEVLQEMLSKHPQFPPVLPPAPVPFPARLLESAILKGVKSFRSSSAHGPSGLWPSQLQEAVGCPSPDRAISTSPPCLASSTSSPPASLLLLFYSIFVVLPSLLARKRVVISAPLQWGEYCNS